MTAELMSLSVLAVNQYKVGSKNNSMMLPQGAPWFNALGTLDTFYHRVSYQVLPSEFCSFERRFMRQKCTSI
jgi:hypothetical protein